MPDITLCSNAACPRAEQCYRHMAVPDKLIQSFAHFEHLDCEYFWPVEVGQRVRDVFAQKKAPVTVND